MTPVCGPLTADQYEGLARDLRRYRKRRDKLLTEMTDGELDDDKLVLVGCLGRRMKQIEMLLHNHAGAGVTL